MELSNYLVSWVVTYLGDLQPTYIGVISYNLFTKFHRHPSIHHSTLPLSSVCHRDIYLHEWLNFHGKLVGKLYHSHSDPLSKTHATRLGFPHVQRSLSEGHPGNSARRAWSVRKILHGMGHGFRQPKKRINWSPIEMSPVENCSKLMVGDILTKKILGIWLGVGRTDSDGVLSGHSEMFLLGHFKRNFGWSTPWKFTMPLKILQSLKICHPKKGMDRLPTPSFFRGYSLMEEMLHRLGCRPMVYDKPVSRISGCHQQYPP